MIQYRKVGDKMAKRFQFDDEDFDEEIEQTSHIDELEKRKEEPVSYEYNDTQENTQFNDEDDFMSKKEILYGNGGIIYLLLLVFYL